MIFFITCRATEEDEEKMDHRALLVCPAFQEKKYSTKHICSLNGEGTWTIFISKCNYIFLVFV